MALRGRRASDGTDLVLRARSQRGNMIKSGGRRVTAGIVAVLCLGVGVLAVPSPVGAVSASWQVPLSLARLATLPDGSVAALASGQLTHVTPAGTVDWTYPDATADQGPVADSDGNVYWTSNDNCAPNCSARLVSVSKSGVLRWSTTLSTYATVPIKEGPDGLIYVGAGSTNGPQLYGISKLDGHIVFTAPMDLLPSDSDAIFPYSGGVAIVAPDALTYYTAAGEIIQRYPLGGVFQWRGVGTPDGHVYVVRGDCTTGGVTTLTAYTQSAQGWQKQIANGCGYGNAPYLAVLPDGGVVVNLAPDGTFGNGETVYNADGSFRWELGLTAPSGAWRIDYALAPLVDVNGIIAVPYQFAFPCQSNSDTCWGVKVEFINGSSGGTAGSTLLQVSDPTPESYGNPLRSAASAPGQIYLSLGHLNGGQYSSTTHNELLMSSRVTGVGAPWPQSVFWGPGSSPSTPTLTLTPASATSPINATDVSTAQLSSNGSPVSGSTVSFSVTAGPCAGKTAALPTDSTGLAAWGYACNVAGVDTITATASVPDGAGGSVSASATTTITWTSPTTPKIGAWGDSFISGEGAPNPDPTLGFLLGTDQTGNHCHRSSKSYAALIAATKHMGLDFHACSGAIVQDFYTPFSQNHPGEGSGELPQLDTVSSQDTIGLLSIDGNNSLFPEVMNYCATRQFGQNSCERVWGKAVKQRLEEIAASPTLPGLYRDVHRRMAPGASLYVIGYPRFFPVNPPKSCNTGVPGLPVPTFSRSDMKWINEQIAALDDINHQAANAAGVKFIDVYDVFKDHEMCNTRGNKEWMNRALPALPSFNLAWSFHPNVDGHFAEAQWIAARMN